MKTAEKQNTADHASQELIQIVTEHKQQAEKVKEIVTMKNNTVKSYLICYYLFIFIIQFILLLYPTPIDKRT